MITHITSEHGGSTRHLTKDEHAEQLRVAASSYRIDHGWHTQVIGNQLMLTLGRETVGVSVPAGWGVEINHKLAMAELSCPVLQLPGPRDMWIFLAAKPDLSVLPPLPYFVNLMHRRHRIPLPPSWTGKGPLGWIVAPVRRSTGIPCLSQLLSVIRDSTPLAIDHDNPPTMNESLSPERQRSSQPLARRLVRSLDNLT